MRNKIVLFCLIQYVLFTSFGCVSANRKLPSSLNEVSGVARIANGNTYWINDGGNPALLFESGISPRQVTSFDVSMKNVDWEGLAPYRDSLLCICDIGDNRTRRKSINIAILNSRGEVLNDRQLNYPDHAYNAEACAIRGEDFYILTKARIGKKGASKTNMAYLFKLNLQSGESVLTLKDSLNFSQRSVTDMAWQTDEELVIVGYDYRRKALFPRTLTSVYSVEVDDTDHFRKNTFRNRTVPAPFIWTQYESILPVGDGKVLIASERTRLFSPRWRIVNLPK